MNSILKRLTILMMLLPAISLAESGWFGVAAEEHDEAVKVSDLMAEIQNWEDRSVMVSGRITDVCTHRGCWAVFEDDGEILRIMARDHSFALPAEARGPAVAHGMLERVEISPDHARHLVEDDGADPAVMEQEFEYRLIAEGVHLIP